MKVIFFYIHLFQSDSPQTEINRYWPQIKELLRVFHNADSLSPSFNETHQSLEEATQNIEEILYFDRIPSFHLLIGNTHCVEEKKKIANTFPKVEIEKLLQSSFSSDLITDERNGNSNREHQNEETLNLTSTIHKIQGGERKAIIFSAVRSNLIGDIGFYKSKDGPAFITVAATRPKERLVMIFDQRTFATAPENQFLKSEELPYAERVSQMFHTIEEFYQAWISSPHPVGENWRKQIERYLLPVESAI